MALNLTEEGRERTLDAQVSRDPRLIYNDTGASDGVGSRKVGKSPQCNRARSRQPLQLMRGSGWALVGFADFKSVGPDPAVGTVGSTPSRSRHKLRRDLELVSG